MEFYLLSSLPAWQNLFSQHFGEVVHATVFDQGRNAEGKQVPKFGFVTFRNASDCAKVLKQRVSFEGNPGYSRSHTQALLHQGNHTFVIGDTVYKYEC